MIWFQYFPRNWLAATLQLTCEEDGVYHRLCDWCYINECELPHDVDECCRIARAVTRSERDAVTRVTRDYFEKTSAGLAQRHIAQKVEKYLTGEPERQARRSLDAERKRRSRAIQRSLYATLRKAGIHAPAGMPMAALNDMVRSAGLSHADGLWTNGRDAPKPPPRNDTNGSHASGETSGPDMSRSHDALEIQQYIKTEEEAHASSARAPTRAGEACRAMRQSGLSTTNPSDPRLHALLDAGVTNDELAYAAAKAVAEGKRDAWAYTLAVVRAQREDAARPIAARVQSAAAARVAEIAPGLEAMP